MASRLPTRGHRQVLGVMRDHGRPYVRSPCSFAAIVDILFYNRVMQKSSIVKEHFVQRVMLVVGKCWDAKKVQILGNCHGWSTLRAGRNEPKVLDNFPTGESVFRDAIDRLRIGI